MAEETNIVVDMSSLTSGSKYRVPGLFAQGTINIAMYTNVALYFRKKINLSHNNYATWKTLL